MADTSRTKVCYIISDVEKALAFEWLVEELDHDKFEMIFILIGAKDTPMAQFLERKGIKCTTIRHRARWHFVMTSWTLWGILWRERPKIVHTHLLTANLVGLLVSYILRVPRRVYTRHHSVLHHYYHPKGIWYDRLSNFLATDVIALCQQSKEILAEWENVPSQKITTIPHGFDLDSFQHLDQSRVDKLRSKYDITDHSPVIGVIARFTEWKGIQYIIPAFAQLLKTHPLAHLVLANAYGDYSDSIHRQLEEIVPPTAVTQIHFEEDLQGLYQLFDVYVHVPIDPYVEAFGQTYVEALAAGIPSVFTRSGVACDFVMDGQNAMLVDYKSPEEIRVAMERILTDGDLKDSLIKKGRESVAALYDIQTTVKALQNLYGQQ